MARSSAAPGRLITVFCAAEVLGMLGNATFPALIPQFRDLWGLSNTEAGWISGVYFAGYITAVPVLVAMTDRADARRIYLASTALGGLAALGFALLAQGVWSAMVFRFLGGVGLAGTYMVGLKLLSDFIEGPGQSRAVAIYTAHFGPGVALSTLAAGEVEAVLDWRWAFGIAALGSLAALALVLVLVPAAVRTSSSGRARNVRTLDVENGGRVRALDLRPVFANRPALAYVLGYAAHIWELFGTRAWLVAFLAFGFAQQPAGTDYPFTVTQIATVVLFLGLPASILGNELALRFGRRRVAASTMAVSAALSCVLGFLGGAPISVLAAVLVLHHMLLMGDSSVLTAGAVARAEPGRRGATMAVHALLGFGAGMLSPLAFGAVLDLAGGGGILAWGLAFALLGLGSAGLGLPVLARMGRERL